MTYIHDTCGGEVELIYPDGCYDDNYGLCTVCGEEGDLTIIDTDSIQKIVLVLIRITVIRE